MAAMFLGFIAQQIFRDASGPFCTMRHSRHQNGAGQLDNLPQI